MAQERVQKQQGRREDTQTDVTHSDVSNPELAEKTDETLASIDDALEGQLDEELLAALDEVLEEDAQAFVDAYVQQGGQ